MAPANAETSEGQSKGRGLQAITRELSLPLQDEELATLRAGEWVLVSGTVHLISGCAAHTLQEEWSEEIAPFIEPEGSLFFADASEAPLGKVLGSIEPIPAGPLAMLSCAILDEGIRCIIGSGPINEDTRDRLKKKRGVYLSVMQGTGALLARTVHQAEVVACESLEQGAIKRLKVSRMPCMIALDGFGRYLYNQDAIKDTSPEETNQTT